MKLFRLRGKHNDPKAEKELVLDTGRGDSSAPGAQAPPESEPASSNSDEPVVDLDAAAPQSAPPADLFAELSAQADKEMAEQEQLAAGEPSTDDDELDPGLLDIFRDAKSEVEESSLAADLENVPARAILDDIRGISQGLGIPPDGLRTRQEAALEEPDGLAERGVAEVAQTGAEGAVSPPEIALPLHEATEPESGGKVAPGEGAVQESETGQGAGAQEESENRAGVR